MNKTIVKLISVLAILVMIFTGCGSDSKSSDSDMKSATGYEENNVSEAPAENQDGAGTQNIIVNRKLIKKVDIYSETKDFEKLVSTINKKVTEFSGYIESSNLSGNSYSNNSLRNSYITIRVPSARLDEFVEMVENESNVYSKEMNTSDVTLEYVDLDSRKKALIAEQASLLSLLEKAKTIADIISLQDRLSNVRYEVQTIESQLRTFDNQVDYSTVTLSIREVDRITKVKVDKVSERMGDGFMKSVNNIKNGFINFFVWLISNILYLILWAGFGFGLYKLIKKLSKRKTKNQIYNNPSEQNSQNLQNPPNPQNNQTKM